MRVHGKNGGFWSSDESTIQDISGTNFCIFYSLGQVRAYVTRLSGLWELCAAEHMSQTAPIPGARLRKCTVKNSRMEGNINARYKRAIQKHLDRQKNQPYCIIVTLDEVCRYQKINFGFNLTPADFQFIICDALDYTHSTIPRPDHTIYLDDCTIRIYANGEKGAQLRLACQKMMESL